jgi:hypothetical protein
MHFASENYSCKNIISINLVKGIIDLLFLFILLLNVSMNKEKAEEVEGERAVSFVSRKVSDLAIFS